MYIWDKLNRSLMKQEIKNRISALRQRMKELNLSAFIIPSSDPHMSEYVAEHWKVRQWISGFDGSAGTVVVTMTHAGLWTDSRYFIQATDQLKDTGIDLYKEMLPETPSITEFICSHLQPGEAVGVDGQQFSVDLYEVLRHDFEAVGIVLESRDQIINEVWSDRPALPLDPPFIYELKYAGVSCADKLEAIRTKLASRNADGILVSTLDEIAWTLNLRGNDVECNPVFISYLLITAHDAVLFIDPAKMTDEVENYLKSSGVQWLPYSETAKTLHHLNNLKLSLQPNKTNYTMFTSISESCDKLLADSPIALLKAVRNEVEIAGLHQAMKRDGVAMVRFLHWLQNAIVTGTETELSVAAKLEEFRKEGDFYKGPSFGTISGYGPHGAIVHYSATPETNAALEPKSFLLLDSGGQYLDGTTDITRTIALGELTDEEKLDYTLVLKGHIALAMAHFPKGTRGAQLDVLARTALWQNGMNYLHGTGHGIGHFLNVHEGPQSIRMNENPVTLEVGMVTSNEPGAYKAGKHGVRIESLILTCKAGEGMFGDYYKFQTVTLCPIDTRPIVSGVLTEEEAAWLNSYHFMVRETLTPLLNDAEKAWLANATQPIALR